ncbi:MAG: hypothetical protein WCK88_01340 [bacterium]
MSIILKATELFCKNPSDDTHAVVSSSSSDSIGFIKNHNGRNMATANDIG